jgi:predicted ATPase
MIVAGESEVQTGSAAFGLKLVEEGLAVQRAAGLKSFFPFLGAVAATAHLRAGNHARALDLLSETIDFARRLKFGWYLPEAERLATEASLQAGTISATEAMRRLEVAAQLAGQQSAVLLQWRANLSLARLLIEAGRLDEARVHLNAICRTVGDGLDAPEL